MVKFCFDRVASFIGLVLLSPLFLVISLWVKMGSEGPVFFLQERVGKDGKLFKIIKFRTMVKDAPKLGPAVTGGDDPRITSAGRFLRRYKLDELPQLINVLKGEMSLVGPRPEVPRYVDVTGNEWRQVLKLRPGITGVSQIAHIDEEGLLSGQANPEEFYLREVLPKKMALDLEYVRSHGMIKDFSIIFKTLAGIRR